MQSGGHGVPCETQVKSIRRMRRSRCADCRIAILPSPVYVSVFRGMGWNPPCLERTRVRKLLYNGMTRFSAGNTTLFDVLVIRDFRIGISTRFASPRVRQRLGRFVPSLRRSRGFHARRLRGHSTPPGIPRPPPGKTSPVTSPRYAFIRRKRTWPARPGPWDSHGGPSQN